MYGRRSPIDATVLQTAVLLALTLGAPGCNTSDPPPPAAVERAEVYCDSCRQKVDRKDTDSRISPEGMDVYVCRACIADPRRGKPAARGGSTNRTRGKS